MTADDPLMNREQIAEYVGRISVRTIYDDMKRPAEDRRHLAAVKVLGKLMARRSDVEAWIARIAEPAA